MEDAAATINNRVARPRLCVGVLAVMNKADLLPSSEVSLDADAIAVSALTGQGLDELCQRILQQLVPTPPKRGEAVIFTPRQEQTFREAAAALAAGDSALAVMWLRIL